MPLPPAPPPAERKEDNAKDVPLLLPQCHHRQWPVCGGGDMWTSPPMLAPHADLIELVLSSSSSSDRSLCDTSSSAEYKSCDEEDDDDDTRKCGLIPPVRSVSLDLAIVSSATACCSSSAAAARQRCFSASDFGRRRHFDDDDDDEDEEVVNGGREDDTFLPEESAATRLPQCSSSSVGQLSVASSSNSDPTVPTCRICHLTAADSSGGGLISPCRCSGTMQFIHSVCLMKWLEVSNRKSKRPPSCELCLYQYHRHKKFKADHWQFPQCTIRDKVLHAMFFLSLLTMIGAATVTVLYFKQEKGSRVTVDRNRLTHSEIVTLVCGVLFFFSFFLAMYVEIKAKSTIYKLVTDFMYLNQQWYIDEYDKKTDVQTVAV